MEKVQRSTGRRLGASAGLFGLVAVAATGCTPEVDAILTILRVLGWIF